MNVSLSSRAQLPINVLLCICSLLPAGCATHKAASPTPVPTTAQPQQPVAVSPPPAMTVSPVRPRQTEQPIKAAQPAPKPATPAPVPTAVKPTPASAHAVAAKPVTIDAAKPVPSQPVPPKSAQPKAEQPKTDAVNAEPRRPEAGTAASPGGPAAPVTETITVALNDLPMSIHSQWILDRDESRCTLQSVTQRMDDGQGGTRISLWLTTSTLAFSTESDIDLSYTGTGITIGEQHFDLETVERRTNPAFIKQRSALLKAMKDGQTLQLTLGFWPTWPVTHTYSVSFPLQHFATAHAAWENCNTQLSQR